MPYRTNADLPADQTDQYSAKQKRAFRLVWNKVHRETGEDDRAFQAAHAAAKRAGS